MSNLAFNVTWQEILNEEPVHCRAIEADKNFHDEIIKGIALKILGSEDLMHPDLNIIGSTDKAPDINLCRNLINNLALKPVLAKYRLGVVMNAGKLLLPAANSLLKLSEEPPSHACILFLMDDAKFFLPTLKSRSRFSKIIISNENERVAEKMPDNLNIWLDWISKARSKDIDELIKNLESWENYAIDNKNFSQAEIIDRIKILAAKKNLSVNMLCDLIILVLTNLNINLKSEAINNFEHVFSSVW